MISGIQILGVLFGLFLLFLTFLYQKRREFNVKEWGFWSILWISFIIISIIPSSLDFVVRDVLNMTRPLDFLIIVGFMFLIGTSFYTYSAVRRNQRRIEEIVRKVAIRRAR